LEKKTIQESAAITAEELLSFWAKARIPTRQKYHIINKVKEHHLKWQGLKKAATRRTEKQKQNEDLFTSVLDDLFDVAHADALVIIKIPEDREFLLAQREKGRRGCMGSKDMILHGVEKRRCDRQQIAEKRRKCEQERVASSSNACALETSDSSTDEEDPVDKSYIPMKNTPKKVGHRHIVSPEMASSLDRTMISDRKATFVLASVAKALGHDPSELVLNKESVRQSWRQHRQAAAYHIKETFDVDGPTGPLTIHWDGKILPALTGNDKVDRLAVLVS